MEYKKAILDYANDKAKEYVKEMNITKDVELVIITYRAGLLDGMEFMLKNTVEMEGKL